jgi:transcriptional regulatory protein LEU3
MNTQTPNEYYELSPFLFWTIVVTGSRYYPEDPSILDRISQLITPFAFSSMALRSTPIPVIQGLLILCTWRLPTNSMYKDMTHMLCGAAVHLATQIGLHVDGVGQDFARMPLKKDQEHTMFRARIWMYCAIVSIRTSCAEGIPPLVIADTFFDGDEREREETLAHLPLDLQFNHKLYVILHKAMAAMARTNLKSMTCDFRVLRSLIGIFDAQLLTLAATSPSELGTSYTLLLDTLLS